MQGKKAPGKPPQGSKMVAPRTPSRMNKGSGLPPMKTAAPPYRMPKRKGA